MPVRLPSQYGGLSQGLTQGFGMMNLIDRTKMQQQEQANLVQYRNATIALQQQQEQRLSQHQRFSEIANNTSTFLSNIKDAPYEMKAKAVPAFLASLPDNTPPAIKASLQQIDFTNQEALKAETKAMGEFNKLLKRGTPDTKGLMGFSANNMNTQIGKLALVWSESLSKQSNITSSIKNFTAAIHDGSWTAQRDPNNPRSGGFAYFMEHQARSKASSSILNVNTAQKPMTKLGEEMSKSLVEDRANAAGSMMALKNISDAENLLNSGIITGVGAKFLTEAGNLLSSRLGIHIADDPIKNTEAYARIVGTQVGQIIKQFGSGTGLSDADREYAEGIVGGDITLTEKSLKKIISINKRGHLNIIRNFNVRAEQAMSKPGAENLPYDLRIKAPKRAIDYLKKHPELADQFKAKYGYLPKGF